MFLEPTRKSGHPLTRNNSYPPTVDVPVAGPHCFFPPLRFFSKTRRYLLCYDSPGFSYIFLNSFILKNIMWNYHALLLQINIWSPFPLMDHALKQGLVVRLMFHSSLLNQTFVLIMIKKKYQKKKVYMLTVDLLDYSEKSQAKVENI